MFTGSGEFAGAPVQVGDFVEVTGRVEEAGGDFTRIAGLEVLRELAPGPTVGLTPVSLPETFQGELERYEGMLVQIASDVVIAQNFFLDRYGQLTLAAPGSTTRPVTPTNLFKGSADPASEAQLLFDENLRRSLVLDDGQDINPNGDNPIPVPFYPLPADFAAGAVIRAGDGVSNLFGVIDQGAIGFSGQRDHRLQAVSQPAFDERNPRTALPEDVGGGLRVASFNVLNYFVTLDQDGNQCGPDLDQGCRGADNAVEFDRQTAKLVAALCAVDADIVGLIEIENGPQGANPAIDALVAAMGDCGSGTGVDLYAGQAPAGPLGIDVITNPFIFKPATVLPVADAVLDSSVDTRFDTDNQRPAYAVTFEELGSGELFTVVNNHWKSKGSLTGKPKDNDQGDLQGSNNFTRTQGALALVEWLAMDPTGRGDRDVLIIGDLNSYGEEDPVQVLEDAGFDDLLESLPSGDAYSFTFDGEVGALDHGLTSPSLSRQVTGVTLWHINTDEPEFLAYEQSFNPEGYFVADAWRSSDHDPVIVGLQLASIELATRGSEGRIQLRWTDVQDALGYNVYRSTRPDGPYDLVVNATENTLYLDTGVANGVTHYYFVVVVGQDGAEGIGSGVVSATPRGRARR